MFNRYFLNSLILSYLLYIWWNQLKEFVFFFFFFFFFFFSYGSSRMPEEKKKTCKVMIEWHLGEKNSAIQAMSNRRHSIHCLSSPRKLFWKGREIIVTNICIIVTKLFYIYHLHEFLISTLQTRGEIRENFQIPESFQNTVSIRWLQGSTRGPVIFLPNYLPPLKKKCVTVRARTLWLRF